MNERIRELKRQATIWCDDNIPERFSEEIGGYGSAWEDKFAELIIKECVSVCMDHRVGNQDYNTGRLHCSFDIKDYFGVKE